MNQRTFLLLALMIGTTNSAWAQETSPAAPNNTPPPAAAAPATEADEFDSLGGNQILLDRAKALEPNKRVSIVQARTVDRRHRVEIAPEISGTFGGEAYNRTKAVGLNLNYHFTPRISVGLKYNYNFNTLTEEGEALVDQAYADYQADPENPDSPFPELDYAKSEYMALINWYPIYGKMNLFDTGVAHFDFYLLGGYGQVQLLSGTTDTYTAGAGVGFWITQHLTARIEGRYQAYTAKYFSGDRDLDLAIGSFQLGWLL